MARIGVMNMSSDDNQKPSKLFLPTLGVAYFAAWPSLVIISILLLDIANSFDQPIGIASIIRTMFSIVGIPSAILIGILIMKYNNKTLLIIGLIFVSFSAFGSAISINLSMMIIMFSLAGVGLNTIEPMIYSLIGDCLPFENRGRAISWIMTSLALAPIIGSPIIGFIAEIGSWRLSFIGFMLPIAIISIVMTLKWIPTPKCKNAYFLSDQFSYFEGFKEILTNHSAISCLIGTAFVMASFQVISFFSASYFREIYFVSIGTSSILYGVYSFGYIIGVQASGRLLNLIGRKRISIITLTIVGFLTLFYMLIVHFWIAVILLIIISICFGMVFTALSSLTLEQIKNRGTMMAMNSASWSGGAGLGAGLGGLVLLYYDFKILGFILGTLSILSALIIYGFVIDITQNNQKNPPTNDNQ